VVPHSPPPLLVALPLSLSKGPASTTNTYQLRSTLLDPLTIEEGIFTNDRFSTVRDTEAQNPSD